MCDCHHTCHYSAESIPLRTHCWMMYHLSTEKSPPLPSHTLPHLGTAEQGCTGVVTYKNSRSPPLSTVCWQSAVMAPVISSMSNFIRGGIRWTPRCTAGSRWPGMLTSTVLSLSPHGPSERSEILSLPPYFDLPLLHNNTAATPLHATVFWIIRHQRPALVVTAADVSSQG